MPSPETIIEKIKSVAHEILELESIDLIRRPEWGTLTFEAAQTDFTRIYWLMHRLLQVRLELVTDDRLQEISQRVEGALAALQAVNSFTITDNSISHRDAINRMREQGRDVLTSIVPWLPLAASNDDALREVEALRVARANAEGDSIVFRSEAGQELEKIKGIVAAAQSAAAETGVAKFAGIFNEESVRLEGRAKHWLKITLFLGLFTLGLAIWFYNWRITGDANEVIQALFAKVVGISIVLSATVWCGRIAKALMHQSAVSRFRAQGLQTFQTFTLAAADAQTKQAILLETMKAIFADYRTGYIEEKGSSGDGDLRFLEVIKTVVPGSGGK